MHEIQRVLKSGGGAGIYASDYKKMLQAPSTPGLQELNRLMRRFREENASPYHARHQHQYHLEAGFLLSEGFAFAVEGENPQMIPLMNKVVLKPAIEYLRLWIIEHSLTDNTHLDELLAEAQAWSESQTPSLL